MCASSVDNNSSFHNCQCIRVSCAGDAESPAAVGGSERERTAEKMRIEREKSVVWCVLNEAISPIQLDWQPAHTDIKPEEKKTKMGLCQKRTASACFVCISG